MSAGVAEEIDASTCSAGTCRRAVLSAAIARAPIIPLILFALPPQGCDLISNIGASTARPPARRIGLRLQWLQAVRSLSSRRREADFASVSAAPGAVRSRPEERQTWP